jgi:flagellar biosynthetic protein FliR
MMGFVLAFPIIALSILSDIIFGMIMKTMPSFNLLVVGFPVKIVVSITVLMAILGSFAYIFKREFFLMMNLLQKLFS